MKCNVRQTHERGSVILLAMEKLQQYGKARHLWMKRSKDFGDKEKWDGYEL